MFLSISQKTGTQAATAVWSELSDVERIVIVLSPLSLVVPFNQYTKTYPSSSTAVKSLQYIPSAVWTSPCETLPPTMLTDPSTSPVEIISSTLKASSGGL